MNDFFTSIINSQPSSREEKINFILVCHIVPTIIPFLEAIKGIGKIPLVIPKGSCRDKKTLDEVNKDKNIKFLDNYIGQETKYKTYEKDYRKLIKENAIDIINDLIVKEKVGQKFVIIDIGGYFAPCYWSLCNAFNKKQFLGIVEDTENGHQAYENYVFDLHKKLNKKESEIERINDFQILDDPYINYPKLIWLFQKIENLKKEEDSIKELENNVKSDKETKNMANQLNLDELRDSNNDQFGQICSVIKSFNDQLLAQLIGEDITSLYSNFKQYLEENHDDKLTEMQNKMVPIYSVARSELKKTEDYNVGKSIVEASGTVLRVEAHTMLERMKTIGVIGFGKIGKSISDHLRQKNIREVLVYDRDDIRQMEACSLGFKVVPRSKLLRKSEMIFGASGGHCLEEYDISLLKDNVYIASCTSRDDEFDQTFFKALEKSENLTEETIIKSYNVQVKNGADVRVNMLNNGNSINFVHGAVLGPYIYSVQAGLIVAAIKLINNTNIGANKMQLLTQDEINQIANIWLSFFEKQTVRDENSPENIKFIEKLKRDSEDAALLKGHYKACASYIVDNYCTDNRHLETQEIVTYLKRDPSNIINFQVVIKAISSIKEYFPRFTCYLCDSIYEKLDDKQKAEVTEIKSYISVKYRVKPGYVHRIAPLPFSISGCSQNRSIRITRFVIPQCFVSFF